MKKTPLHKRLQQAREEAGISRGALAKAAGLDRAYYGRLEAGAVPNPSWNAVCALARVLNLPLDELRTDTPLA